MSAKHRVYIGLGSNLDQPAQQLRQALRELDRLPGTSCLTHSRLYQSRPMGPQDQPDYINAVALLETKLDPLSLLGALQAIEAAHGRQRGEQRWGPRTLDLDILLYNSKQIDLPRLKIPHPGLYERPFVLYPLQEIAPSELTVPGHGPLKELVRRCPTEGLNVLVDE